MERANRRLPRISGIRSRDVTAAASTCAPIRRTIRSFRELTRDVHVWRAQPRSQRRYPSLSSCPFRETLRAPAPAAEPQTQFLAECPTPRTRGEAPARADRCRRLTPPAQPERRSYGQPERNSGPGRTRFDWSYKLTCWFKAARESAIALRGSSARSVRS